MKVSIITATYNSEATISTCLNSIKSQSYPDIEHIVIDGSSTDRTLEIISELSPESIVYSESDEGLYDALNKGIGKASGEVLGFLHADDVFTDTTVIQNILAHFADTEVQGVYGDLEYLRSNGSVQRYWASGEFHSKRIGQGWMPPHPTLFLRSSVYKSFGSFNTSYRIAADYEFILRILKADLLLHYIPASLVRMQLGGISNRSLRNIIQKSYEDYKALKQNSIKSPFIVLLRKNSSKISQFF